ncbi:hypothetical protein [Neisseria sp. WF04]|nr:hypothetical protein [Neisseria sp. WF04]
MPQRQSNGHAIALPYAHATRLMPPKQCKGRLKTGKLPEQRQTQTE